MGEAWDSLASLAGLLAAVARTPHVPPVVPGTEIAGRYLVVGVIGAGGMGVVYRARDLQLQRDVAIKLCSRVAEEERNRLIGEALAMARLSHPNVITVHEVGRHGDDVFVVMELVSGSTLRSWLAAARRPVRDVVRAFLEAAAGLHAVHRAGLVHGDFKPDNVLVGDDARVRLVDFGLARVGEGVGSAPSGAGGTPRYMAPEVRNGWYPSQRSDQYSFCVALAEALGPRAPRRIARALARGQHEDAFRRHESVGALRRLLRQQLATRRGVLGAGIAIGAVLLLAVAAALVTDLAEANRARADVLRLAALELDVEQGRRELAAGNTGPGLAYLAHALASGVDRPAVRFLLARGLAAVEQTYIELPALRRDPVTAVIFLRRGPRAVVGDSGGTIVVHDPAGRRARVLAGHLGAVRTLAVMDAAETRLLSTGDDGRALLWDVATGELLENSAAATNAAASDVVRGDDGTVRVVDGELVATLPHPERVAVALRLPGGRVLTGCDDGVVRLWDLAAGVTITSFAGHTGPVTTLLVDGERLVSAGRDATVRVWDLASGRQIVNLAGHREGVVALALAEDLVLTGSEDGTARVWQVGGGGFVGSLPVSSERRHRAAWFAGRDRVVAVDADGMADVHQAFDDGTWQRVGFESLPVPVAGPGLAAVGDGDGGTLFAVARARTVELWDLDSRELVTRLRARGEVRGVRWSGDGKFLLGYGDGATLWDATSCGGARVEIPAGDVTTAALSPRGDRIILATGRTLAFHDASGRRLFALARLEAAPLHVIFDPSGTMVALGSGDGRVEIWDASAGRGGRELGRHGAPVVALRFSPDGALLYSLGSDRKVRVWDVANRTELWVMSVDAFGGLDLSPDGSRLLVHQSLGRVSLWDVSREPRLAPRVAEVVGCLVPLRRDDAGRLVRSEPGPECQ